MSDGINFERVNELRAQGFDSGLAFGITFLEKKIKDWPPEWGDNLLVLIYGDFEPPSEDISFPALGITINHKCKDKTKTIASSAMCALEAWVKTDGKSKPAVNDAIRRMNLFLGVWTLIEMGSGAFGWYSYITHGLGAAGMVKLGDKDLNPGISRILSLPDPIRRKVDAALYWVREPRNLLSNSYRSDILRIYSAYWNAFECLIDAVNKDNPRSKLSESEKQGQIDKLLKERGGKLTSEVIVQCYHEIVNPGFIGNASHALKMCFPNDADRYINECFKIRESRNHPNRLYSIRNAIDHGDIDAENPEELLRIESRLTLLHIIVWGLFTHIINVAR